MKGCVFMSINSIATNPYTPVASFAGATDLLGAAGTASKDINSCKTVQEVKEYYDEKNKALNIRYYAVLSGTYVPWFVALKCAPQIANNPLVVVGLIGVNIANVVMTVKKKEALVKECKAQLAKIIACP